MIPHLCSMVRRDQMEFPSPRPTSGWDQKLPSEHREKSPIWGRVQIYELSALRSKTATLPDEETIIRGGLGSP